MTEEKRVRLKLPKISKRDNITVRFSDSELASVCGNAKLYTGGDLSKWIRYAATHFKPKASDLETIE